MDDKLGIPLFFVIFGFIISFVISLISGSSMLGTLIRSLLSSLILGALGYLLIFLLDKFSEESNENIKKERTIGNKDNSAKDYLRESHKGVDEKNKNYNLSDDGSESYSEINNTSEAEEGDQISYEQLFAKLSTGENEEKSQEINKDKDKDKDTISIEENKTNKNYDLYKKSVIDEMDKQKEKETIEIDFSNDAQIIEGDSDIKQGSITAEEAAKITATSRMSSVVGEVKGIDDKYIYFTKGSKIENKPEKIAKVIKEMLKNE